ncbi:MAG: peptidase S10 [Alphaproteobacteria bacterium]|nr:MAG: peptidase S10 [Alphaproteobacteria bacterium]
MILRLSLFALILATTQPAIAQEADKPDKPGRSEKADEPIPPPNRSVTRHSGSFGGVKIGYTATTGETYLRDKDGKPTAAIFSTSYVKDGADPRRPVTFLYNGGPGSGSVWLHMGAFGPKRVRIADARDDGAPPYPIVDNPDSLLDVTDIVFIDPVGTGFSHALGKTDPKTFWGVTADAKSINDFIRLWLNENKRWNAPKFIGGESYGTTRSAALIHELTGAYNDVAVNGVILISTILDFGAEAETEGNEMQYVVTLPSMAAVAWYHKALPQQAAALEPFLDEARAFARGPYITALLKGNALTAEERATVRRQLAGFTGLSEAYLDRANLRVSPDRFYKELLRDRGTTVGRLDARYLGIDYDNAGEGPDNDPSFYGIDASYTAAINSWARDGLGYKTDRQYVTIGSVGPWDWKLGGSRDGTTYVNVAPYLSKALRENSGMKVFVGQGYYDFATPFFGAEQSLTRPGFPAGRVEFHYYQAGHMMYVHDSDLTKLSRDIRGFIERQETPAG